MVSLIFGAYRFSHGQQFPPLNPYAPEFKGGGSIGGATPPSSPSSTLSVANSLGGGGLVSFSPQPTAVPLALSPQPTPVNMVPVAVIAPAPMGYDPALMPHNDPTFVPYDDPTMVPGTSWADAPEFVPQPSVPPAELPTQIQTTSKVRNYSPT